MLPTLNHNRDYGLYKKIEAIIKDATAVVKHVCEKPESLTYIHISVRRKAEGISK